MFQGKEGIRWEAFKKMFAESGWAEVGGEEPKKSDIKIDWQKWLNESYDLKEQSKYELRQGRVHNSMIQLRDSFFNKYDHLKKCFDVTDAVIVK